MRTIYLLNDREKYIKAMYLLLHDRQKNKDDFLL